MGGLVSERVDGEYLLWDVASHVFIPWTWDWERREEIFLSQLTHVRVSQRCRVSKAGSRGRLTH